jgi:hypothetical protein
VSNETAGPDDERLLDELRGMFERTDPVPPWLTEAAKRSFDLRRIDAELAELVRDSALEDLAPEAVPAGVRGESEPRSLTFDADGLVVELELTGDGRRLRLVGQLVPPSAARVEVRTQPAPAPGDGTEPASVVVEADDSGLFTVGGLEPGLLSLTCHRPGQPSVTTDWVLVD